MHRHRCCVAVCAATSTGGGCPVRLLCTESPRSLTCVFSTLVVACRLGVKPALLHETYSQPLTSALKKAMLQFERRMPGFATDVGLLHGVETRTSAPVRIRGAC